MQVNKIAIVEAIKFAFVSLWHNKLLYAKILLFNVCVLLLAMLLEFLVLSAASAVLLTLFTSQPLSSVGTTIIQCIKHISCDQFNQLLQELHDNSLYALVIAIPFIAGTLFLLMSAWSVLWFGSNKVALDIYQSGTSSMQSYFFAIYLRRKILKFAVLWTLLYFVVPINIVLLMLLLLALLPPTVASVGVVVIAISLLLLAFLFLFLMVKGIFWGFVLVDSNATVFHAFRTSYKITKGHWFELFVLILIVWILGFGISLIPGVKYIASFITSFLMALSLAHAYRTVQGKPRGTSSASFN